MSDQNRIGFLVEKLQLETHPEGGYFKEVYRSPEMIQQNALPERYSGDRSFSTSIYYLIMGGKPSLFHRIKSDEIWHFYEGTSVDVHIISEKGNYEKVIMGAGDSSHPPLYQRTFEKNSWFGGIVRDQASYCLLGCTVAPGFDFEDFEMAERENMLELYPEHSEIISLLT